MRWGVHRNLAATYFDYGARKIFLVMYYQYYTYIQLAVVDIL